MKRIILVFSVGLMVVFAACKGKNKTENAEQQTTTSEQQTENSPAAATPAANQPKTYEVVFAPDTAYLGKKKEAFVRVKNAKAVELSDADGKITGTEITYELEVTNKNQVGGNGIFINPADFRLQLDNGNNLTHDNYNSLNVDAESTKSSTDNKFRLPAGAKPKSLNLFYDETRVAMGVEMK